MSIVFDVLVTCLDGWFNPKRHLLACLLQEPFSVRDDIPDLSDDDITAAKFPEPMKPTVLSFKSKNDSDLFGLGIEERSIKSKDSSEEQDGKSLEKNNFVYGEC